MIHLDGSAGTLGMVLRQLVQKEHTVEMSRLVLQHSSDQPGTLQFHFAALGVEAGDARPVGPDDRELQTWGREAPLFIVVGPRRYVENVRGLQSGVDDPPSVPSWLAAFFGTVEDEDPQSDTDLRRRQSHTLGGGQGVMHVRDQRPDVVGE
jgi:hypothetical protein